jgi:hypothetical protein
MPHGNATTCRHDITPRYLCKLCKAEDDLMRRPSKRKEPIAIRRARLLEENRRLLAKADREYDERHPK